MKKIRAGATKRKTTSRRRLRSTGQTGTLSIEEIREAVLAVSGKKRSS